MANLRRNAPQNIARAADYKSLLDSAFHPNRMVAEYEELLTAAKDARSLDAWLKTLLAIENRIHGRTPQVIQHEKGDLAQTMELIKQAALEHGFIDAIVAPPPAALLGDMDADSSSSTSTSTASTGGTGDGPDGVPAPVLDGGQLPPVSGAASIP